MRLGFPFIAVLCSFLLTNQAVAQGIAGTLNSTTSQLNTESSGNVGIGTDNPQALLHIHNSTIDNNLFLTGSSPSLRIFQGDWVTSGLRGRIGLATQFSHFVTTSSPGDFIIQC